MTIILDINLILNPNIKLLIVTQSALNIAIIIFNKLLAKALT